MTINNGTFLGPYEILGRVGSGGMGEVYRARDRRLGRYVAIKVLSPATASDRDRLTRFEREARLASSLNHPNIVTIYDVGEENSIPYIAMELVEGKTVRELLASGSISLRQAISIALQIADALSKAHETGIVHRDLKPENVMVTEDGVVKILDFGLGKNAPPPISFAESTIMAAPDPTNPGTILGTVDYMSPEQASGKDTDFRSDQFSFGSIIYEMTAGRRAFRRETAVQTMSAIIGDPPAPLSGNAGVPVPLRQIVDRCLQKNPEQRYASTRELMTELRGLSTRLEASSAGFSSVVTGVSAEKRRLPRVRWMIAAAAVAAALAVSFTPSARQALLQFVQFSRPLPTSKNLVVLPFQVDDQTADSQQFAAGLREAITGALTQLTTDPSLQMSPSSEVTARQVATADDARAILAANLVVTGSVQRDGDTLRVNWNIEDTSSHEPLRSGTISVEASERLELESRTVEAVIDALDLNIEPSQRAALLVRDTRFPAAKEAYLRGRGYLQDFDKEENVRHAAALFEDALKVDPNYARAYAGLGEAFWRLYDRWIRSNELIDRARENCQRAIAIDDKQSAGHGCLGTVYFAEGRYEDAVIEYQRALDSEPTNDDYRREAARAEEKRGKFAEAEETLREAIRLRPQYWANYNVLGSFYFNRTNYAQAAAMFSEVIRLAPDTAFGYANLGAAYIKLGEYDEAISMLRRAVSIRATSTAYSNLGTTYFQQRQYIEAAETFQQALKIDERNHILWANLGDAYYWAEGKRGQALPAYARAISLVEEALKINSRDAVLVSRLALYNAMINDREKAESALKRALEIAPDDAEVRFKAALIYNQFKEVDQTIDWLEKAAQAGYSVTTIRHTRNFDHLWAYERFLNLLRKY